MNASFYLALERLPIGLVAAMEFMGPMALALWGCRDGRNLAALALTAVGVAILIDVRWSSHLVGLGWSAANAALFVAYIVIAHRNASESPSAGVEQLGAAMLVALIATPASGPRVTWLNQPARRPRCRGPTSASRRSASAR